MKKENLAAMIYGAFYGDAYSLGAHWIYDTDTIKNSSFDLTRCNDPISQYHPTKKAGEFTHYGDQMLWLLEHLAQYKKFSLVDFGNFWHLKMQNYSGYIDGASKHTINKLNEERNFFSCGSNSSDLAAISRMFPIILAYQSSFSEMQEAIKLHTILTHMSRELILCGYFISELAVALLHKVALEKAISETAKHSDPVIQNWIQKALDCKQSDSINAVKDLGQSCGVSGAFSSTIYILLKYQDDLEIALKQNFLAGGDSAARGIIIGALLSIIDPKSIHAFKHQISKINEIEDFISVIETNQEN